MIRKIKLAEIIVRVLFVAGSPAACAASSRWERFGMRGTAASMKRPREMSRPSDGERYANSLRRCGGKSAASPEAS